MPLTHHITVELVGPGEGDSPLQSCYAIQDNFYREQN